jgi:hypothetical protein
MGSRDNAFNLILGVQGSDKMLGIFRDNNSAGSQKSHFLSLLYWDIQILFLMWASNQMILKVVSLAAVGVLVSNSVDLSKRGGPPSSFRLRYLVNFSCRLRISSINCSFFYETSRNLSSSSTQLNSFFSSLHSLIRRPFPRIRSSARLARDNVVALRTTSPF